MSLSFLGPGTRETQTQNNLSLHLHEHQLEPDAARNLLSLGCEPHGSGLEDDIGNRLSSLSMAWTCPPCMASSMLHDSEGGLGMYSQSTCIISPTNRYVGSTGEILNLDSFDVSQNVSFDPSTSSSLEVSLDSTLLDYDYPQHELSILGESQVNHLFCPPNYSQASGDYLRTRIYDCGEDTHQTPYTSKDVRLNQIPGIDRIISAVSTFLNPCQLQPSSRRPPLPDPYSNSILYVQTSTLLPYLHNARCIGLEIEDLLAMRSTFYRPDTTMADDTASLLAAARKPWIPTHLQPTLAQILFPHHPYLDLLPFPILRERAITFATMFNPRELKLDIFQNGLACYPHSRNGGTMSSKQPWDIRSWEVKPWFLKKWRLLMDSPATGGDKVIDDMPGAGLVISMS
jgi:hypothetical protein